MIGRVLASCKFYPRSVTCKARRCVTHYRLTSNRLPFKSTFHRYLSTEPLQQVSTLSDKVDCIGCGTQLQTNYPSERGYIKSDVLATHHNIPPDSEDSEEITNNDSSILICQRCHYLQNYNTALNISLSADDYKRHLTVLKDKRALVLLIVDAVDFPGSLFPDLYHVLGHRNHVQVIVNKIDLLPNCNRKTLQTLEEYIRKKATAEGLKGLDIKKVWFISSKTGKGIDSLSREIVHSWGNRGDVYLLGCTNVGKSSLFNHLIIDLCGALPGDTETISGVSAPAPIISHWPGTTLGLISFPVLSVGKRRRLLAQSYRVQPDNSSGNDGMRIRDLFVARKSTSHSNPGVYQCLPDIEDVLQEIGLRKVEKKKVVQPKPPIKVESNPLNRIWLHDTPGAINDIQLINHLTTKELSLLLPKKALSPRTFILKPGYSLLVAGLARIDYEQGPSSAYFTVFCASSLPIHTTPSIKADGVYERNLGKPLLKVPFGDQSRLQSFPSLASQSFTIEGIGLYHCVCDVILSSVGWVSVTLGNGQVGTVRAYTPSGKGMWLRQPSLVPEAIQERGRRSQKGNRTAFRGKSSIRT